MVGYIIVSRFGAVGVNNSTNIFSVTGLLLSQAALTLLKDDTVAIKSGGGVLTPATLGQPFIDRLNAAGYRFETKMLEH